MARQPRDPSRGNDGTDSKKSATHVSFIDPNGQEITRHARPAPAADTETHAAQVPDADPATQHVREQALELGEALYAKFIQILTDKVDENDGAIDADDIAAMGQEFRKELESIETAFLDAVETYTEAQLQPRTEESRSHCFQRLMIHNFAERFADERALRDQPELLSRRMLPGFFSILTLMFGQDRLADYETRAHGVIDAVRGDGDGPIDWDAAYASPAARRLCLKAEIEIAQFFVQTDKRLQWMIAVINSNLIVLDADPTHDSWTMTTPAAEKLLASLFKDLRGALMRDQTRAKISERMGTASLNLLDVIMKRFS